MRHEARRELASVDQQRVLQLTPFRLGVMPENMATRVRTS